MAWCAAPPLHCCYNLECNNMLAPSSLVRAAGRFPRYSVFRKDGCAYFQYPESETTNLLAVRFAASQPGRTQECLLSTFYLHLPLPAGFAIVSLHTYCLEMRTCCHAILRGSAGCASAYTVELQYSSHIYSRKFFKGGRSFQLGKKWSKSILWKYFFLQLLFLYNCNFCFCWKSFRSAPNHYFTEQW